MFLEITLEILQEDIDAAYRHHEGIWWFDPSFSPIAIAALRQNLGKKADYTTLDGRPLSPSASAYQLAFGHSLYGEFKIAEYQAAKHFRANTGNTGAIELKSTKAVKPITLNVVVDDRETNDAQD